MADGQVVFEVVADDRPARNTMRQLTGDIREEAQNWGQAGEEASDNISAAFSDMLKKVSKYITSAKIGQKLLEIGKEAINLASDLEEVQNVVDVTFGKDASKIDTWAKNAASQFGLTETQAKKFTSTLGAMMKSSGLAGSEITDMSTQLAGLSADMASFYNLDFEEAFNKIRSGISGETEPLKQLGINMSVANLNAFALKQGLSKTFEQMSQGEQIMLRYQYLMEATSDAQGDFARTSDGYANSVRLLETNIDSLKTKIGTYLLPAISDIVTTINNLFGEEAESKAKRFSLLDKINEIQIQKDAKIEEINLITTEANSLLDSLQKIGADTTAPETLKKLAAGANTLDSNSPANWQAVMGALTGIDGLDNLFGENTNTETIEELSKALSGQGVSTTKAQAWQTFLGALANNSDAVSKLTGTSAEETKKWLEDMAQAAGELSPDDAAAWNTLMSSLVSGVSLNTEEGRKFVEDLATQFLALGSDSSDAVNGLAALGFSTDEISEKQQAWLQICKELVNTMPGLSDMIDTNTGEIKGGIPAVKQYADEWKRAAEYQAEIESLQAMREAYNAENNIAKKKADVTGTEAILKARLKSSNLQVDPDKIIEEIKNNVAGVIAGETDDWYYKIFGEGRSYDEINDAIYEYGEALISLGRAERELPLVNEIIAESEEEVAEKYGMTTEAVEKEMAASKEAAKASSVLERAAKGESEAFTEVETALKNANDALKAMADHAQGVHDKITSTLSGVAKGFEAIETPMMKNAKQTKDLTDKINGLDKNSKTYKEDLQKLNEEMAKASGEKITAQGMGANLKQQAEWMDEYLKNLQKARNMGVDESILAQLADGSEESFDYLAAIAEASPSEVQKINENWQKVIDKKKQLADELTGQQLTVDETYQNLAAEAKKAVAELDLEQEAANNAGKTVEGMAKGISGKVPELQAAVDDVCAQLNRLEGWGINLSLGEFGTVQFGGGSGSTREKNGVTYYSHANGLDWVPYDNYFARLHEGEAVLTAEENKIWQRYRNGSLNGVDYDQLGGVMRENVKAGGNVYLDGHIVGSVISDRQGRSYRSLQRSGWQQ